MPWKEPVLQLLPHTLHRPHRPHVIVELGEASKDCLKKFAFRIRIDGLGDGDYLHAVFEERGLDVEVIGNVASQAVQLPDQEYIRFAFVFSTVIDELQKLRAVCE